MTETEGPRCPAKIQIKKTRPFPCMSRCRQINDECYECFTCGFVFFWNEDEGYLNDRD